jgi:hypothetical protein
MKDNLFKVYLFTVSLNSLKPQQMRGPALKVNITHKNEIVIRSLGGRRREEGGSMWRRLDRR